MQLTPAVGLTWRRLLPLAALLWVGGLGAGCSSPGGADAGSGGSGGFPTGAAGAGAGAAGAGSGAAGGAGGACAGGGTSDAGVADASPDAIAGCEACEAANAYSVPSCDPTSLSAVHDISGNPIGWGVDTLSTAAERQTGWALLRCLNANHCAANSTNSDAGSNAALGCFCGSGVAPESCISGDGVHGVCIPEYEAAATATPSGPVACSSLAAFSIFVATATAGFSGPIALAGNIERCAIDSGCAICAGL